MPMRTINFANSKGRDAVVASESVRRSLKVRWLDPKGRQVQNARLLRGTLDRDYDQLMKRFGEPAALAKALVDGDPELDIETYGTVLSETSRVFVDVDRKIVHAVQEFEVVHNADGSIKERRPRVVLAPNVAAETPLKWSGKLVKKSDVYRKFVFVGKQQIVHINGLTYDFLFAMAKELEEKDSFLLVGAGPKSNQPLIFQRGATPFRGFLEGRTRGDRYCLLLHLSNLELKTPTAAAAPAVNEPSATPDTGAQ